MTNTPDADVNDERTVAEAAFRSPAERGDDSVEAPDDGPETSISAVGAGPNAVFDGRRRTGR